MELLRASVVYWELKLKAQSKGLGELIATSSSKNKKKKKHVGNIRVANFKLEKKPNQHHLERSKYIVRRVGPLNCICFKTNVKHFLEFKCCNPVLLFISTVRNNREDNI